MKLRQRNEILLNDDRVRLINKVMDGIHDTSNSIYESVIDNDHRMSLHYINKMIQTCESLKFKLKELLSYD